MRRGAQMGWGALSMLWGPLAPDAKTQALNMGVGKIGGAHALTRHITLAVFSFVDMGKLGKRLCHSGIIPFVQSYWHKRNLLGAAL